MKDHIWVPPGMADKAHTLAPVTRDSADQQPGNVRQYTFSQEKGKRMTFWLCKAFPCKIFMI